MSETPSNPNFHHTSGGRLVLRRAPELRFFTQKISIPGISVRTASQPTPHDSVPRPGDALYRSPLRVVFKVDEDLTNYATLWDWFVGIAAPDRASQYAELAAASPTSGSGVTSDLTITVANSSWNHAIEYRFQDAFPLNLTGVEYTTVGEDVTMATAEVDFQFRHFTVHRKVVDWD